MPELYVTDDVGKAFATFQNPPVGYNNYIVLVRVDDEGQLASVITIGMNTNYGIYYTGWEQLFSGGRALPAKGWESEGEPEGMDDEDQVYDLLEYLIDEKGFYAILWEDDRGNSQKITPSTKWEQKAYRLVNI